MLTLLFPVLMDWIGASATFALLAAMTVMALWWTRANVPETKELTLEEIGELFERRERIP